MVSASAPGYFATQQRSENVWFSAQPITNALSSGTNTLSTALYVTPENAQAGILSVTGLVGGADSGTTNPLPGVIVQVEYEADNDNDEEDEPEIAAWAVTDSNGAYSIPVPTGMPGIVFAATPDLTINRWIGSGAQLSGPRANLTCLRPDTLLKGTLKGSDEKALGGVEFFITAEEPSMTGAQAMTMTNGCYEVGVIGGTTNEAELSENALYAQHYLPAEDEFSIAIPAGQLVYTNETITADKGARLKGYVYDVLTNGLPDGTVGGASTTSIEWLYSCRTDNAGYYELLLTTGTYNVETSMDSFSGYSPGRSNSVVLPSYGLNNVNFFLQQAAIISGSVTAMQDAVVSWVEAMRITNASPRCTEFAAGANVTNGTYSLEVASGYDYIVRIKPDTNSYYAEAYYSGKDTDQTADLVSPTAQTPATNINFVLTQGMRVSGSVSNSSGSALSDIMITPSIWVTGAWTHAESARTDGSGNYSFVTGNTNGLIVFAGLFDPQSGTLGNMYYNQVLSSDMATLLDFAAGTTRSNISFQLFQAGSLQVHLDYNPGTMLESTRWRLKNSTYETNWFTSDHRIENLPVGTYTTEYSSLDGWDTPPEQTAVLTNNASVQITATYTQQVGSLTTYLTPSGAVTAGAQWRLTSGSDTNWYDSESSMNHLAVSSYTQTFKTVDGWYTPADQLIVITKDQTTVNTGTYTEITYGNLQVSLLPADVTNAAQWRITSSSNWYSSAYTLTNIVTGTYTAECSRVSGWRAPGAIAVSITDGTTTVTSLTYEVRSGSLGALMLLLQE